MQTKKILVSDIGGTNSRFAIFSLQDTKNLSPEKTVKSHTTNFETKDKDSENKLVLVDKFWLKTSSVHSFQELLELLFKEKQNWNDTAFDLAVFAVAGPINNRKSSPPNISWDVDLDTLKAYPNIKNSLLINDFLSQGYACLAPQYIQENIQETSIGEIAIAETLSNSTPPLTSKMSSKKFSIKEIIKGELSESSPKLIIGPGTGLGQATLVPVTIANENLYNNTNIQENFLLEPGKGNILNKKTGDYLGLSSEGGQVTLPIETYREFEFFLFAKHYLKQELVTADNILCGKGLQLLELFLRNGAKIIKNLENSSEDINLKMLLNPQEITSLNLKKDLASEDNPLYWFMRFLGRFVRNAYLANLAFGGIYFAGGILIQNPQLFELPIFKQTFYRHPKHSDLLKRATMYLLDDQDSGLWGSAVYGAKLLS